MAGRMVRSCVQTALKAANSVVGLAGMAVILYALWMLRAWYREIAGLGQRPPAPWFIYTFLGLGIFLCILTCSGHIAAETANGHCLYCGFPPDPSGKFGDFKHFVRSNSEICEWVGLSVVAAQVLSIVLGMVLRTLGPDRETDYDSEDDTAVPARLPLLRNQSQHGSWDYAEATTSRQGLPLLHSKCVQR
ncbi:Tetraspanin-19 [Zea mays]|uniref:Tetraspanin-19 n=1 Tax=Zea mays TaxID=4577 RepID=A0A1D6DT42_MAIZE|nr:Tetraspanin-19 [Zea mays]